MTESHAILLPIYAKRITLESKEHIHKADGSQDVFTSLVSDDKARFGRRQRGSTKKNVYQTGQLSRM